MAGRQFMLFIFKTASSEAVFIPEYKDNSIHSNQKEHKE